ALLVTDQGSPDLPALALLGSGPWSVAVPRVAASEETASVGGVEAASVLLDQGGLAERLAELRGGDDADPADEPGAAEDSSGADLILRDSDLLDFFDESAVGKGHEDLEFAPFGEDEGVLSADDLPQQGLVSAPRSAAADAVDPNARDRFDDMAMRRAVDDLPALMAVPPPEDLAKAASDALAAELQEALEALDAESVPSAPAPRATALDETASATPGPAAEVPDRPDPMPLRTPAAPASGWGFSERVPDLGPASQPESAGDGKSAAQSAAAVELMVVPSVGPGVADTQGDAEPVGEGATVARLRVRSAVLNRLVDGAGEIGLYRARLSQRNGLLGAVLLALDQTMRRLHDQLHQLEIETAALIRDRGEHEPSAAGEGSEGDPRAVDRFSTLHQLARGLAGIGKDLLGQRDLISGYQRQSTDLLAQQARLTDHLQDGLLGARMVPFGQVVPRLRRILRSTADCLGKVVRLEVIGPEVELDRLTLDRLAAPLEQLVRNAVDHGLETPSARVAAGKPATGTVTVALSRDGDEVLLTLSDDGRGLDLAAIRAKAQARGLLSLAAESAPTDLMQFLFEPDFSTPELETQSAGRGAGLAVVAVAVKSLHGAVELASPGGLGTSVSIRLPLTRAILNVFLVGVGDQTYAVPHATVEGAARIGRDDLAAIYQGQRRDFEHNGHTYRVAHLGGLLDSQGPPVLGERRWLPLLLAHLGEQRVALQVDTLTESTRVIVKPLAGPLAALHWLAGGTILPDGRVALILDPLALLRGGTAHRW
ncbi:MAG TPA: ATP-binding protein, partial [Lamprocystis sp. (in: g-proteobacteria)]|nr:ATP-binding protein [Lamprocystis sp. (in: g-proteobacteria)]